jgi:hypothetical protein
MSSPLLHVIGAARAFRQKLRITAAHAIECHELSIFDGPVIL